MIRQTLQAWAGDGDMDAPRENVSGQGPGSQHRPKLVAGLIMISFFPQCGGNRLDDESRAVFLPRWQLADDESQILRRDGQSLFNGPAAENLGGHT